MTTSSLGWPTHCKHLYEGSFAPFSVLALRDAPDKEPGLHETHSTIELCPFCAGAIIAMVRRELDSVP